MLSSWAVSNTQVSGLLMAGLHKSRHACFGVAVAAFACIQHLPALQI
jgi:hypothetical protein